VKRSDGDSKQQNINPDFLKQIRPGMDLERLSFPAYIIRCISAIETHTAFCAPLDNILNVSTIEDPVERLLKITRWILCGFISVPSKTYEQLKPYNSVLGEQFACTWEHADGSISSFLGEQVSHHPPVTCSMMENRVHNIRYHSTTHPKTHLHANSASSVFANGETFLELLNLGERYEITFPVILVRGLLFGRKYVELHKDLVVRCEQTGYEAVMHFVDKSDNDVEGQVQTIIEEDGDKKKKKKWSWYGSSSSEKPQKVYKFGGNLTTKVTITSVATEREEVFLDPSTYRRPPKKCAPIATQAPNESRRVWHGVTRALIKKDYETANLYKHAVEEKQRKITKERNSRGEAWNQAYFRRQEDGKWRSVYYNSPDGADFAAEVARHVNKTL